MLRPSLRHSDLLGPKHLTSLFAVSVHDNVIRLLLLYLLLKLIAHAVGFNLLAQVIVEVVLELALAGLFHHRQSLMVHLHGQVNFLPLILLLFHHVQVFLVGWQR